MHPISKVLISNLFSFKKMWAQIPNFGILSKKYQLSNLNKILLLSYIEGADFKYDFRFRKSWNFITSLIKINYLVFWFYLLNYGQVRHAVRFLHKHL